MPSAAILPATLTIPLHSNQSLSSCRAKKSKQLLKARLCRERQVYEMRKRAELKAAISELKRPWEVVERSPVLFSFSADEQVKVLANRFQRPTGFDMWSERDGPQLFRSPDNLPSARFFPKGAVHSLKPYSAVAGDMPDGVDGSDEGGKAMRYNDLIARGAGSIGTGSQVKRVSSESKGLPDSGKSIDGDTGESLGSYCSDSEILFSDSRKEEEECHDQNDGLHFSDSKNASSSSSSLLSVLCPLLKFFGGGDPSQERNDIIEVITSTLSTVARLPWGSKSLNETAHSLESIGNSPKLQLYEFEACPFCRRVREAMTELDLSAEVYPCPKGSRRHREVVRKSGGKEQFPFLVDLNNGVSMYESGDIVRYLFQQYGLGSSPSFGLLESTLFTGWVPTLLRAGRGMTLWERAAPEPPSNMIELFSIENNQYARIVREALCELELPYILRNVGEGSSNTKLLVSASGSKEVPYLVDPNTGARIGDYKKILSYLFQNYSAAD